MLELALDMKVVSNMKLPLVEIISKLSFGVHERRDEKNVHNIPSACDWLILNLNYVNLIYIQGMEIEVNNI